MTQAGLIEIHDLAEFKTQLRAPRIVFLYIPAGPGVDQTLDALGAQLEPGDILVDGGNSYWGDSIRRQQRLAEQGIQLVDLGTSGGIEGARHGACFMAGGEQAAIAQVEPILLTLATAGGYVYAGPPGAGHFTKLVHNGIEFGMLQAIAEGIDLLAHYHDTLAIADVLRCWRHGSVIRSWLIDLMDETYRAAGGLEKIPPYVEDTGEVNWLIGDATRMEVSVPVLAAAVMRLFAARDDQQLAPRAIAMMRHGFGGHPYGPNAAIERERREGRVGDLFPATPQAAVSALANGQHDRMNEAYGISHAGEERQS